jgi:galactose mutarotase-like enzyme
MTSYSSRAADAVAIRGKTTAVVSLSGPNLRVAIVPSQGGEVASLEVLHKDSWVETLHRALDYANFNDEWRGRAPLQWPAVGRNCVPEELNQKATGQDLMMGSWRCEGKRYPMPILGFAQYMEFELVEHGSSNSSAWAECRATDCDYSRQYYPFAFELRYRHTIEGNELRTRCIVRSRESRRSMPFSSGNHITFHLPFTSEGNFEECIFTSPTTHHLELNAQDLLNGRRLPKDLRKGGKLVDKELWNMVLGGYTRDNAFVELRDPHSFGFRISQAEISIGKAPRFSDIHFILYAERLYQSFCPEPWMGEPNSLNSGKAVVNLGPGEEFCWEMRATTLKSDE